MLLRPKKIFLWVDYQSSLEIGELSFERTRKMRVRRNIEKCELIRWKISSFIQCLKLLSHPPTHPEIAEAYEKEKREEKLAGHLLKYFA